MPGDCATVPRIGAGWLFCFMSVSVCALTSLGVRRFTSYFVVDNASSFKYPSCSCRTLSWPPALDFTMIVRVAPIPIAITIMSVSNDARGHITLVVHWKLNTCELCSCCVRICVVIATLHIRASLPHLNVAWSCCWELALCGEVWQVSIIALLAAAFFQFLQGSAVWYHAKRIVSIVSARCTTLRMVI